MAAPDRFGLVGSVLGDKYQVERVLGEGGYGIVYAAKHLVLDTALAIKCLKPEWGSVEEQEKGIAAFRREARILSGLLHPAIVRFFDVGVVAERGVQYAVFELLTGKTLADDIAERAAAKRPYTKGDLASIFGAIAEGVAFAHERGVIHRDLKPANIMLVPDGSKVAPKILDFGTARAIEPDKPTAASIGAFTPLYAAPEQWDRTRGDIGPASDVYALGVMLAEMCLLRYPFPYDPRRGVPELLITKLDEKKRPALAKERQDLPAEMEEVVIRALRVRPKDRQANAGELLVAFRNAIRAATATAPMPRPIMPPRSATVPMPSRPHPAPPSSPSTPQIAVAPVTPSSPYLPVAAPVPRPAPSNPTSPDEPPPEVPKTTPLPWIMVLVFLTIAALVIGAGIYVAMRLHRP